MLWIDHVGVLLLFLPLLAIVYYLIGDITFGRNQASWILEFYFPCGLLILYMYRHVSFKSLRCWEVVYCQLLCCL
jgi:hypothetical protein